MTKQEAIRIMLDWNWMVHPEVTAPVGFISNTFIIKTGIETSKKVDINDLPQSGWHTTDNWDYNKKCWK